MRSVTSGEQGNIDAIPRKEAMEILSKPLSLSRRTWFGIKYRATSRNSRGPGSAVDIINYGLRVGDKCRAVMRIGNAPWRNTALPNLLKSSYPKRYEDESKFTWRDQLA